MARQYTHPRRLWLGLPALMLAITAWAGEAHKPASWVELNAALNPINSGEAELTLQISTPLPTDSVSIALQLPDGTATTGAGHRTMELTPHQAETLEWPLQGPFDYNTPIGIEVIFTLPDGHTLSHREQTEWPQPQRRLDRRAEPPGSNQYRQGETLRVVPLAAGSD